MFNGKKIKQLQGVISDLREENAELLKANQQHVDNLKEAESGWASCKTELGNALKQLHAAQSDVEFFKDKYKDALTYLSKKSVVTLEDERKMKAAREEKREKKQLKEVQLEFVFTPDVAKPKNFWISTAELSGLTGIVSPASTRKWAKRWGVRVKKVSGRLNYALADVYKALEIYQRGKWQKTLDKIKAS